MTRRSLAILSVVVCSYFTPAIVGARDAVLKKPSFDSEGVPIHYVVTGREDGEPVVLIHGFAGSIDAQWSRIIPTLAKDFKVIALDCRGHGGSGKPREAQKYGVEMVNDVARLLDHLKIDKAHIVGYSMGSTIALSFAVYHPKRVRSVTLGGSSGLQRGQEELIAAVADSLEKGNGMGPLLIALTPKSQPQPTPEAIKAVDAAVFSVNDVKALAAVARAAASVKLSDEQVEAIRVPVQVLIGADDPLRSGVDHLEKLLPTTRVVVIDKADHMTAFLRPEFVSELRQFLEANREQPKSQSGRPVLIDSER